MALLASDKPSINAVIKALSLLYSLNLKSSSKKTLEVLKLLLMIFEVNKGRTLNIN